MISDDTTIANLLEAHPELVDFLAGYHSHFAHLRNRLLRKVVAPRVTVAQAARIAGVPGDELLAALRRAVGEEAPTALAGEPGEPRESPVTRSAPLPPSIARLRRVDLDVRDDIRRGEEPFARIMATVKALPPDGVLVLRAPFEPIPLYDVLGKRGFAHWTQCHGPSDWSVWFSRETTPRARIDVRGLEPPQPMVRVLERLEALGDGEQLEVLHARRPMFLYPLLDERGFSHETDEPEPGLVRILIQRRAP